MVRKSVRTERLSKTALLAGAALALPVASKAGVVYVNSGAVPFTLTSASSATPTTQSGTLTIDSTGVFSFTANGNTTTGEDTVTAVSSGAEWVGLAIDPYYTPAATPLVAGTDIGPGMSSTYSFYGGTGILQKVFGDPGTTAQKGPWPTDGSSAYLGIEFDGPDALLHYGWVQVSACVPDNSGSTNPCNDPNALLTVDSYAYQSTANTDILAGQTADTPEPSSFALFALGAAGLLAFRRRKQAA